MFMETTKEKNILLFIICIDDLFYTVETNIFSYSLKWSIFSILEKMKYKRKKRTENTER